MRSAVILLTLFVLAVAAPAAAQKKQKDLVLHQYLIQEFAQMNAKLDRLNERVTALEAELARVKQSGTELMTEVRSTQTTVKTMDTSLSTFRLSSQQDLFSLKTDLTQVRQDLGRMMDLLMKTAQPAPAPPPPDQPVEGYITAVDTDGQIVTINLGSSAGVRLGSEFDVYKSNDLKRKIGIIEVTEILDANNSRAKIVYVQPSFRFEFSDVVRPR
jgi:chromosome segregation ATPase